MPQEASEGRRLLRHGQYVPSNPPRGRTTHRRDSDCDEVQDSQGNRVRPCIPGSSITGTRIQEHQVQCEAQSSWRLDTFPPKTTTQPRSSARSPISTGRRSLRYPLELPVEAVIKHSKVTKAERCVTSRDKAQTRQALVDIKGTVPEEVDLGNWGTYKLRPFVPEPLRCYKCQKFGHHQSRCHKNVRCGICSQSHMTEMCIQKHKDGTITTAKCPNCGKKHHAWSTSCPERRERMQVAMAKVQPQNRIEAPHSTFVWGQQRQNTVNPTPTPPQLSEDSFPALPLPGYRTKLKTPGQNQSMQKTMTNQWTPQPQLQSCVAVKVQNTAVLVENTILPGTLQPLQATTQLNTPQPANLQAAFTEEQIKQMITIMIVTFYTIMQKQDTSTENIINAVMTQLTEKMQEDQTPKTPQLRVEQTTPLRQISDKRKNLPSKRSLKTVKPQAPCNRSRRIEQQTQTVSKHTITDKSDSTLKREEKLPRFHLLLLPQNRRPRNSHHS
ncbi:Nucleic-acid-binding protein from mobile element jockey-like 4 [Homarus americanus]|uniref:Nucleic-acid-binding protein from mobile element jockey-like 4 n=1 Tax=Homarus americanus TaxID=6706 RepID=A0A8J5N1D1_HOMAM|nr:Nucleic-acid-binding protein from mobile element jockey-like 4 [Homarus americanus]